MGLEAKITAARIARAAHLTTIVLWEERKAELERFIAMETEHIIELDERIEALSLKEIKNI